MTREIVAYLASTEVDELDAIASLGCQQRFQLLILRENSQARREGSVTVLSPPAGTGQGTLQKIAFEFAAELSATLLCIIDGGNLPAKEELFSHLSEIASKPELNALYIARSDAGKGLIDRVGATVLRTIHNLLVGVNLRDLHSAYRIYRVPVGVPLDQNSEFHSFQIEITIQLAIAGKKIEERGSKIQSQPLPLSELFSRAWSIFALSLRQRVQRFGILYDSRFDLSVDNDYYPAKFDFPSSHSFAVDSLKLNDRILLLGSGPAILVKPFLQKTKHIEAIDQYAAPELKAICEFASGEDLNELASIKEGEKFDKIYALDIIEHLMSPERLLKILRENNRTSGARLIITTPNIAFLPVRIMLLFGQFNYGKRGILDKTHTRLFTFYSLRKVLEQEGYKIIEMKGVPAPFPLALGRNVIADALLALNLACIQLFRTLFSFQLYVEAEALPTARQLLTMSSTPEEEQQQVLG